MEITRQIATTRRYVPNCVMLLCPYESVERIVKDAITKTKLSYKYPEYSSSFFIDDDDLSAEIYVCQPNKTKDKFYIEIIRYGGDGFIVPDILFRIANNYKHFEMKSDVSEDYKTYITYILDTYAPLEEHYQAYMKEAIDTYDPPEKDFTRAFQAHIRSICDDHDVNDEHASYLM